MPVAVYNDALSNKRNAIKDNEGKSGIYQWTHLETNKSYIGISINLGRRLRNYYSTAYISHITRKSMIINKAILKYGYSKFKLEILEYCDIKEISKGEQYYMDLLKPYYNILKKAYSSLGYKHTKETLVKINKNLALLNSNKGIKVKITNLKTNSSQEFNSLTDAANSLSTNKTTLRKYILNSEPFKDLYKIEASLPISDYDSNYINHPNYIKIEVVDLDLNTSSIYISIHAAARALGIVHNTISNFFKRNQTRPYKGRYLFKKRW